MHVSSREKNTGPILSGWAFRIWDVPDLVSRGIPKSIGPIGWGIHQFQTAGWFHAAGWPQWADGLKGTYHWLVVDPLPHMFHIFLMGKPP